MHTKRSLRRLPKSMQNEYTVLGWGPKADGGLTGKEWSQRKNNSNFMTEETGIGDEKEAQ